jgi:phage-related protein
MGGIYQAMLALLKQSSEMKKDRLQEIKAANDRKYGAAEEAVDAKKREIDEKIQAAKDEMNRAIAAMAASCAALEDQVTKTGDSVESLYSAPDKLRVQRFTTNADMLKRRLVKLDGEVNSLRVLLNSGKIDNVPRNDLKKLQTQFDNILKHLRSIKRKK